MLSERERESERQQHNRDPARVENYFYVRPHLLTLTLHLSILILSKIQPAFSAVHGIAVDFDSGCHRHPFPEGNREIESQSFVAKTLDVTICGGSATVVPSDLRGFCGTSGVIFPPGLEIVFQFETETKISPDRTRLPWRRLVPI